MTISDETLMAFSDGELSGEERAAVERAMRENPEIARRIARHRALRERIRLAYSAELSEAVPERMLAAARARKDNVVNLQDARPAARAPADSKAASRKPAAGWRPLGAVAAGVLLGLGVGYGLWQGKNPVTRNAAGSLVAAGQLKSALSEQLVAEQAPTAQVHIGLSFRARSGEYCRSFALTSSAVGIACRRNGDWQIQTLMQGQPGAGGDYRTAGTAMPPLLLNSIESQIQGEPLDAAAESAARERGWQAASP